MPAGPEGLTERNFPMSRTMTNARPRVSPSRTRPPVVEADVSLWPWWACLDVEEIDLDAFDDNGNLLPGRSPVRGSK